jgi:acetyl esterase/lipase
MPTGLNPIDPELIAPLQAMPKTRYGALDLSDIPAARQTAREWAAEIARLSPDDETITVTSLEIDRLDGPPVTVRMFRPADATGALPCLVWFFAGGQVVGGADQDDAYLKALAKRLNGVVAAVDYRLAPDAPAPAAAEDGFLAYTHLHEHAGELVLVPDRIGLAGASGGGAVATATTLMLRDRGASTPRLLSLNYPMLDDRSQTPSSHAITDVGIFDRPANLVAWDAVLAGQAGEDGIDPYRAPARAEDLTGFPTTFIAAAELDVFRDEDLAFATHLVADGVPTELHLYAGAYHAWDRFAPDSKLARSFNDTWHDFLHRYLHS